MTVAERSMGLGLRALNRLAGSEMLDRVGVRRPAERALYRATRDGFRVAGRAGRTFQAGTRLGQPARPRKAGGGGGLFDLTPSDEQQMLVEAWRDFAAARLRPAAAAAEKGEGRDEVFAEASELGLTMLGVPEELGGAISERSAVTALLAAETLAHGDAGLAVGALAPAAVATALALWGDADQQATYLPALVGEDIPAAALAIGEPRALFDPNKLETTARRQPGGGYVLDGLKVLVPRAADAELLIVAARLDAGSALFLVEPRNGGVTVRDDRSMGLRGAALGRLNLDGVEVGAGALLGAADPAVFAEVVARARLGWAGIAAGVGRAVLDYVIPYVNERVAFGEPVSHRQAVAFGVSDIAIELEGLRLVALRAAARADAEQDFFREAALARQIAASKGMQIGSEGVQLLGGAGYITEHPVERWYRDLRATGLLEGVLVV